MFCVGIFLKSAECEGKSSYIQVNMALFFLFLLKHSEEISVSFTAIYRINATFQLTVEKEKQSIYIYVQLDIEATKT
jgi:hypothetical protein